LAAACEHHDSSEVKNRNLRYVVMTEKATSQP